MSIYIGCGILSTIHRSALSPSLFWNYPEAVSRLLLEGHKASPWDTKTKRWGPSWGAQ